MIHKKLLVVFVAFLVCSAVFAQRPEDKPLTETDLLKEIEALSPHKPAATPSPVIKGRAADRPAAAPAPAMVKAAAADQPIPLSNIVNSLTATPPPKPDADKTGQSADKKSKGPTVITALEATFDQKKNVAVFIGSVVVKDPDFNVTCDKLTAYLKHGDNAAPPANGTAAKTTPKPANPTPTPTGAGGTPVKKKSGGLDRAHAEMDSPDRKVVVTQDKIESDGTITHGIGISDTADYDANTGDTVLRGMPDVTQGINRCIATDPSTWMRLKRDGDMDAHGPHKTIITDSGDSGRPPSK